MSQCVITTECSQRFAGCISAQKTTYSRRVSLTDSLTDSRHFSVQLQHILAEKFWRRLTTPSPQKNPCGRTDISSDQQKIAENLWNRKIHCRVRNIRPLVPIMCHINPVHAPPSILILYSNPLLGLATRPTPCLHVPPSLLHHSFPC
jgi:hypothetical protein